MIPIYKKELKTYFTTMVGYVFLGILVVATALFFTLTNIDMQSAHYSDTISSMTIIFLILIPVLTMRLFAEEARQKTDQLIFTSPLSVTQIVLGKFFAAVTIFILGMLITLIFPMLITSYGEVPFAQTTGAFLGYTLLGICFIAVGVFISCLTESQSISAIATFAALFSLFLINGFPMPSARGPSVIFIAVVILAFSGIVFERTKSIYAGISSGVILFLFAGVAYLINNTIFDAAMVNTVNWFSLLSRFDNFTIGILDLSSIIYYVTFSAAFVYLTVNAIEKRRWK